MHSSNHATLPDPDRTARQAAVAAALKLYFDGLHHSDTRRLGQVFHAEARYVCATDEPLLHLEMATYFAIVDTRPSPASRGEARHDRIVAMAFAGDATSFVHAECAIGPRFFTDFLTLIRTEGRWQIISKVFHYELRAPSDASEPALPAKD